MITKPNRDLCIMACIFCREPEFLKWLAGMVKPELGDVVFTEENAKTFILNACRVATRNDLDRNPAAAERFHELVRKPYLAWREGGAV